MSGLKIAVIMGGTSFERDFSLKSGKYICSALKQAGHNPVPLDADSNLVDTLLAESPDLAFICVHGMGGEDGTIPSLLEFLRIPYVGSRPATCRAAWNKPDIPFILQRAESSFFKDNAWPQEVALPARAFRDLGAAKALDLVGERILAGYPLAVKPARGGSAMGVSKVESQEGLGQAIMGALAFDDTVLIQAWVEGVELSCTVVEQAGEIEVLPLVEISAKDGIYDTSCRITPGSTDYYCPARLDSLANSLDEVNAAMAKIKECARDVFRAYGCRDFARIDVIWDADKVRVLDIKTFPGMAETSLVPMAVAATGHTMSEFCHSLVMAAYSRGC